MQTRDGYPAGVPCWIDTNQPDPEAAVAFYGGLFGWELEDQMPADAPGHYFAATLEGCAVAAIGSVPQGSPPSPVWNTYVWVQSADQTAAQVKAAGGTVISEPFDVMDAGRMAIFSDPSGAVFSVWQANRHRGAELVNAPGSWNWSDLHTADIEGSKDFYGAVFGWEAVSVDLGAGQWTTWRRPGYGDALEENDPGLRQRMAEFGAPEGFEDAVATLVPIDADAPSHWAVTFSVDDTDAIAAKAAQLGGTVIVEPFDAGPVRMAALRDPQGAVFSIGKYSPPTDD
jgi:predicted enzyme related to lactoylglutathione lyase